MAGSSTDWDNRELCPDDACVGVIRPDGTCSVCGRVSPNAGARRVSADAAGDADRDADGLDEDDDDLDDEDADDDDAEPGAIDDARSADADAAAPGGDEWDRRALCPDGACTGVIGAAGTCSVCGRSAAEIASDSAT